jgi:hypothetical protein
MKSLLRVCALGALLLLLALAPARADVPRPRDDKPKSPQGADITTQMHIEPNFKATEARLLIPRAVWQQMRAGLDGDAAPAAGAVTRFSTLGAAQTAMAGVFLSLAFACGGVWLMRARRKPANKLTQAALGVALVALCGASAGIAYANAGPPPIARSLTSQILVPAAQPYGVYGRVKVEFTDDDYSQITLILPTAKDGKPGEE